MMYIEGTTLFPILIKEPEDFDPKNEYQLIIGLHGGGSTPESLIDLWEDIQGRAFIYVTPQAPFPMNMGEKIVYDWANWPSGDNELIDRSMNVSEKYIEEVIKQIKVKYKISDIYLSGFSQGAIFTYFIGIKHSYLFKGLICMSGPGLLTPLNNPFGGESRPDWLGEKDIQNASDLRIYITHGINDGAAKIELARKSVQILTKNNLDVTFREFEGTHVVPPEHLLREIIEWL